MVAFVGKYCMSKLFSTEEAFVRKRGHGSRAQSLGQKVEEMVAWPALFLEMIGAKAKKSPGICWNPPRTAGSGFPVSHLRCCLDVSPAHSPPTLVQHSSRPKPWQEMGRCKQLALHTVGNHLEDTTGARESLTTRRDRDGEECTRCGCGRRVTREHPLRRKTAPTTGTFSFEHRQNPRDWSWRCPETVSKPVPQPHFTGSV